MSGKLDQSLDDILKTSRGAATSRGRGRGARRSGRPGRVAPTAAPVGGVKKTVRQAKGAVKSAPTGPSGTGIGKIQVSNLPKDVTEAQIKEYFVKSVGPVKKVEISYGPGGVSRGIATIIFVRTDGATKACNALNGLLVDGRPMKIDVILDGKAAASLPGPKGLSERVTAPKSQPKSAVPAKNNAAGAGTRGGKAARGAKKAKGNGRPAKKTAEELDSEMADYWESGATNGGDAATTNGAAQPATGDANMDEEIL